MFEKFRSTMEDTRKDPSQIYTDEITRDEKIYHIGLMVDETSQNLLLVNLETREQKLFKMKRMPKS